MVEIKDLKIGMKAVTISVQVLEIKETREFDYMGTKHRVATSIVEDTTGSMDMPLFDEEIERVKVGDIVKISNGYVNDFNGIKQVRAGKYGKLEVVIPVGGKGNIRSYLKEKKVEKKLKIDDKDAEENWCKKCGKLQDPVILGDYDGMCVPCWKGVQNEEKEEDY